MGEISNETEMVSDWNHSFVFWYGDFLLNLSKFGGISDRLLKKHDKQLGRVYESVCVWKMCEPY